MKRSQLTALLLALVMVFALAACGTAPAPAAPAATEVPATEAPKADAEPAPEPEPEPAGMAVDGDTNKMWQFGTGPSTGNFYAQGTGVDNLLTKRMESPYSQVLVVTGGSTDNCNQLASGEVDFAIVTQTDADALYNGTGAWAGAAYPDLQVVSTLIPGHVRIVVRSDANINCLEDLKGKVFAPGQMGSSGDTTFKKIWEACGYSMDDVKIEYLDLTSMTDAMKDGKIDALLFAGTDPYASLTDLCASMGNKVRILSFSDEEMEKICAANPSYSAYTCAAGTYAGQDYDATIICYNYYIVANADFPTYFAYLICKGLYEEQAWLSDYVAGFATMDAKRGLDTIKMTNVPLHEGAIAYFTEIGLN